MAHTNATGSKPVIDKEVVRQIWRLTGGPDKKLAVYVDPSRPADVKYQVMNVANTPDRSFRFSPSHKFAGYATPNDGTQTEQVERAPEDMPWGEILTMLGGGLLKLGLVVLTVAVVSAVFILSVLGWGSPKRTHSNWSGIKK